MTGDRLQSDILQRTAELRWRAPSALGGIAMGLVTAGMVEVPQPAGIGGDGARLEVFTPPYNSPDQYPLTVALDPAFAAPPAGALALQGYAPFLA